MSSPQQDKLSPEIAPLDVAALSRQFHEAEPFRWVSIDNFLQPAFAERVAASYPSFEDARSKGRSFEAVNEYRKVQVTDYDRFPEPARRLADALASPGFLHALSEITGISNLMWDESLDGGGLHQTAESGRLDVHVDFNIHDKTSWHRRLNLLLYLNPEWDDAWGGTLELWDKDVKRRHHAFSPILNRCVLFETSEISYHGVTPVKCPPSFARKSFAAYYYTREAPPIGVGEAHTTIFKARPDEHLKRYVLMPAEKAQRQIQKQMRRIGSARRKIGSLLR